MPAFTTVMSKHKPETLSKKVMIFEVIQGKWRKEMRIIREKYFRGYENLVNIFL